MTRIANRIENAGTRVTIRAGGAQVFERGGNRLRRRIPVTPNVHAILDMRLSKVRGGTWLFQAATLSGHIEPSSLKKQHAKAVSEATRILREQTGDPERSIAGLEFYTLRHTCPTRWAPHMGPWTLAYLAGHRDMNITKRYIHPREQTIRAAMERATAAAEVQGRHTYGHTGGTVLQEKTAAFTAIN